MQRELAEYERKALTRFRDDYDLKVEAENKVYAGEVHLIETRANVGCPSSQLAAYSQQDVQYINWTILTF